MSEAARIIATIERLPQRVQRFYVSRAVYDRLRAEMKPGWWGSTLRIGGVDEEHRVLRMCAVIPHG